MNRGLLISTATVLLLASTLRMELMALEGGTGMLADVLVVHTEVEFVEMYKGQPLFADIDIFCAQRGSACTG